MIVNAIYRGLSYVTRIYHNSKVIFEKILIDFHVIEDGKLVVMGAYSVTDTDNGLYIDCAPDITWEYPVKNGNVLRITQVHSATKNGNVLEVE